MVSVICSDNQGGAGMLTLFLHSQHSGPLTPVLPLCKIPVISLDPTKSKWHNSGSRFSILSLPPCLTNHQLPEFFVESRPLIFAVTLAS